MSTNRFGFLSGVSTPRRTRWLLGLLVFLTCGWWALAGVGAQTAPSTIIDKDISVNTTWTLTGSPYQLNRTIRVQAGVTLTIEAGVQVVAADDIYLTVYGHLVAEGSAEAPILFTSAVKQPGSWYGIDVGYTSDQPASARLRYVTVEYAMPSGLPNYGALTAHNALIDIGDSLFRASGGNGFAADGANAVLISNSHFEDNDLAALRFSNPRTSDPVLSNLSASGNGLDALVYYAASIEGAHTLENAGLPYALQGGFQITANGKVTVAPGVEIRVDTGFYVYGDLDALGTALAPITFTGMNKTPGGWWGLNISGDFDDLAQARFDHAVIEYGGQPGQFDGSANLMVYSAVVTMTNSTIRNGGKTGIADSGSAPGQGHRLTLRDSSVLNNAGKAYWADDESANPVLRNLVIAGNGVNAIVHRGAVSGNHVWENVGVPYILEWTGGVNDGELVIEPGVEVRMDAGRSFYIQNAALFAIGTPTQPITFTATQSQSGAREPADPQPGAWESIAVLGGSGVINLRYCDIGYGGGQSAMIDLGGSGGSIVNCRLHHSATAALEVRGDNTGVILTHSRIEANGEGVLRNGGGTPVDARYNWWGDASGPSHPSNPNGQGQSISDGVLYQPWLQSPEETAPPSAQSALAVFLGGPKTYAPGATATYFVFYDNLNAQPVANGVLRVVLPALGELVQASGNGLAWPQRRELFWRLGTIAPLSGHTFSFQIRYPWGLPEGLRSTILAQLSGEGVSPSPFDTTHYLAYTPRVITSQSDLSPAQVQAERNAHPEIETLYTQAIAAGFRYGSAQTRMHSDGVEAAQILLLRFQPRLAAFIITRQNDFISGGLVDGSSYTVYRPGEAVRFDLQTGEWQSAPALSAASATGVNWKDCMKQCIEEKLPGHLVKELVKVLDIADAALDCVKAAKGDDSAVIGCSQVIVRKLPGYSQGVELGQCNADCQECEKSGGDCDNEKCHCCTQDKYRCDGSDWLYGTFGIDVKKVRRCSKVTGRYLAEEVYEVCALCDKCVEGANGPSCVPKTALTASQVVVAGGSDLKCHECRKARDPNELFGPEGDLQPGQRVTYTITYENVGQGEAFDVYIMDELDASFDLDSLAISGDGALSAPLRTIFWQVGTLAPKGEIGSSGAISFSVRLKPGLPSGVVIRNQAVVHFPSVPEETATNTVVNVVQPLVAIPQSVQTNAGEPLPLLLQGRDASNLPLDITLIEKPLYGTLGGVLPALTYTPSLAFSGQDQLRFTVSNGVTTSAPAAVTIRVLPSPNDKQAPTVLWTTPGHNEITALATQAPIHGDDGLLYYYPFIQVQFSEPISATSVNTATLQVTKPDGTAVPIAVRYDGVGDQALILLREAPQADISYQARVKADVTDLMGNRMAADYQWSYGVDLSTATPAQSSLYLPLMGK